MSAAGDSSPSRGSVTNFTPSKIRKIGSRKNADTSSLISDSSSGHHGFRASLEGAVEKLRSNSTSESGILDDEEDKNGIKKLLPKVIGSKRRRKKQAKEVEEREMEEAARGRSIAERGTLEDDAHSTQTGDADRSSLITYDSDTDASPFAPPPLSTHPSHVGYLTTTSPLIQSTTLPDTVNPDEKAEDTPKASTFPLTTSDSNLNSASARLQLPNSGSPKRSPSPVGRLKGVLGSRRATSPNISPERKPDETGGSVRSLKESDTGGNRSSRGSVASRLGSIFPEKPAAQPPPSNHSSPERRGIKTPLPIDTTVRPSTPPGGDQRAPAIVNTPPTPTDLGSPRFASTVAAASRERGSSDPTSTANPNIVTSPSGNMISHRRVRSTTATLGPSKLSNITSAPLTPTPENGPSLGSTSQGGFFSSVFSAAQNAANTLSNSIANTSLGGNQNRARSGTGPQEGKAPEAGDVEVESPTEKDDIEITDEKEPAVKTLGMGDLSLSQLGIPEFNSAVNSSTATKLTDDPERRGRSNIIPRDEELPQRSTTSAPGLMTEAILSSDHVDEVQSMVRPRSVYEPSVPGDHTPPNGSVIEGKTGVGRSSSIRSALDSRRKRGSSAATGTTTIGAAIAAANASLANPAQNSSTPKLTGFAVASKKRNRDFHLLLRSVPDDDYLIEDYSCALQREILVHGRLYVSEGHLCFSSNIFGWVTTLVMSFDEIVSVEKRSTALLFKNGLMISTLHAKNIFASFTSRDSTYDLIIGIWKLGHPRLRSSINGVRIDETGGDKTEKDDGNSPSDSGSEDDSEDGEDVYDEDDDENMSFTQADGTGSAVGSEIEATISRKASATAVSSNGVVPDKSKDGGSTAASSDFPGPSTHPPTECSDQDSHYEKVIIDEVVNLPLGKVYNLLFGPASYSWMTDWLINDQKCTEVQIEDKKGLTSDNKIRQSSYIKPLNSGSFGPKSTKCVITETLDALEIEKAVSVTMSTITPDVPSGNVFSTKTKYCLMWGKGNGTRIVINCTIEWTGKSWLKGPIEKGANDGQVTYGKDLLNSLRAVSSSRPRAGTNGTSGAKSRKKGRKVGSSKSTTGRVDGSSDSKTQSASDNWGIFEPLHSPLGPVVSILRPFMSGSLLYGLVAGLLLASVFTIRTGRRETSTKSLGSFSAPERIVAYEEMWRREESELWDWLEERIGMERVNQLHGRAERERSIEDRLREERATEREMDTAIKVTEEKLNALKGVLEKNRPVPPASSSMPSDIPPVELE